MHALQSTLFALVSDGSDTGPEATDTEIDERFELLEDDLHFLSADQVLPYVCEDCEGVGGYYAASFREIVCPHCGGAAHPAQLSGPVDDTSRPRR